MGMINCDSNPDNVNHPSHYTQGYCETIYEIFDILGPEGFKAYCLGNWIKYKSRAQYKNGDENLKKADVYLGWATNGLPVKNKAQYEFSDFLIGDIVEFPFKGLKDVALVSGIIKRVHLSDVDGTPIWMADILGEAGSHYSIPISILKKKTKCDGNHSGPACSDPECWLK